MWCQKIVASSIYVDFCDCGCRFLSWLHFHNTFCIPFNFIVHKSSCNCHFLRDEYRTLYKLPQLILIRTTTEPQCIPYLNTFFLLFIIFTPLNMFAQYVCKE